MPTISQADQHRIDFAQKLLDSGRMKTTRFNSPEFLSCGIRHGLLSGSASLEEAYEVFGKLSHSEALLSKRLKLGMIGGIEALTPAELRSVRENVSGVLHRKKDNS
jgi:hypothetical protein